MRNEVLCFEALFCAQRSPRSWTSLYFKLWWSHPLSTRVLVKFHPEKSFNKEYTGQSMSSKRGRGVEEGPRRYSGGSAAAPQAHWSVSSPALPTPFPTHPFPWCLHTYIYIVVWVMGQAIPFSFIIPETSSCCSWHFSSWEHSEMWLLAQKKKNLNFNCGDPGPAVSLTFESVSIIWSSSLEADRPCWTWAV